jgi:serine O-acetyltransferase
MPHPNGIVIHPDVLIGPNCLIFQQVTLGTNDKGVLTIGGHVDIGAGAKVIGNIRVGNHVRIGENSVVVHDVPDGATVVGIPAKVVKIINNEY